MNLGTYIYELLFRYDCVIVPGFGGFVGNYSPAHIHPSQHRFYPPSKRITFNKYLHNNDGLLANLVSQHENCSFEQAMDIIRKEVTNMERALKSGKRVILEKIGAFILDKEFNVQFEPNLGSNFLLDSYGLHSFQVLPVNKNTGEEKVAEKVSEPRIIPIDRKRELNRLVKVAAAASLFFAMVWIPLKTDLLEQAGINSTFSRIFNTEKGIYNPSRPIRQFSSQNTIEGLSAKLQANETYVSWSFLEESERSSGTPENIIIRASENPEIAVANESNYILTGEYHVVGGCFEYSENAEKLVEKLKRKGFNALMAGQHNGLHVVSYGSFAARKDAVILLNSVKKTENAQAWLLRK